MDLQRKQQLKILCNIQSSKQTVESFPTGYYILKAQAKQHMALLCLCKPNHSYKPHLLLWGTLCGIAIITTASFFKYLLRHNKHVHNSYQHFFSARHGIKIYSLRKAAVALFEKLCLVATVVHRPHWVVQHNYNDFPSFYSLMNASIRL